MSTVVVLFKIVLRDMSTLRRNLIFRPFTPLENGLSLLHFLWNKICTKFHTATEEYKTGSVIIGMCWKNAITIVEFYSSFWAHVNIWVTFILFLTPKVLGCETFCSCNLCTLKVIVLWPFRSMLTQIFRLCLQMECHMSVIHFVTVHWTEQTPQILQMKQKKNCSI